MGQQTTGLGVAAKIAVTGTINPGVTTPGKNGVILSLSSAGGNSATFQLNPVIEDAAGNVVDLGTSFVLTAAASSSGATAVYTGTITGGGSNAFAGLTFTVAGFVATPANNGTFIAVASSATTLTLENAAAVAETHAATAISQEVVAGNHLTYVADGTGAATISATGLLTAVRVGHSVAEVSFPAFNNASGATGAVSPNPMTGLPLNKIYAEVNVKVVV